MRWIDKLEHLQQRLETVGNLLAAPQTGADTQRYKALSKEYKELTHLAALYQDYKKTEQQVKETQELASSPAAEAELKELAKQELHQLHQQQAALTSQLRQALVPQDPHDSRDSILEIRAGTGGDEAAIWAGDLFRMYHRFAEKMHWQLQVLDHTEGTAGGYKEIICTVAGDQVYGTLKYESGVHRVQRVPTTEAQGRLHTSAATVVVLPEVDEVAVDVNMNEVRKDTFCSSGPGGQSVNTTYSAIRLTHLPTGIVVSCQDEKSQLKNLDKALKVLRARLYERAVQEQQQALRAERQSLVRSGDRSEKIRTYNFPQSRVTDHRINHTVHNLPTVLDGGLHSLLEALRMADSAAKLQEEPVQQ